MNRPRPTLLLIPLLLALCPRGEASHTTDTLQIDGSLELIGQPVVVSLGHTGAGTAIVQIENDGLNYRYAEDDVNLFGDCRRPDGAEDHLGWQPEGEDCRIAWVMCILWWEDPPPNNYRLCNFSRNGKPGGHATTTAKVLAQTAPGAKIVAISVCDDSGWCGALNAKGALRWLYNANLGEANVKIERINCNSDEALCQRREHEWRSYWAEQFGKQTPAERFNVVAVNLSFVAVWARDEQLTTMGHFSEHCLPENPDPVNPNPAKYIDDWLAQQNWIADPDWFDFREEFAGLRAVNIAPVTAAGNGLPSQAVTANSVIMPACAEGAVVVSGAPEDYVDEPYPYGPVQSSVSPTLTTLVSPAGTVSDLKLLPGIPWFPHIPFFRRPMSATSWAAPIVTGSIAILRGLDVAPAMTVDETISLLVSTGQPIRENRECNPDKEEHKRPPSLWCPPAELYGDPHEYYLPRLDLEAAVKQALESRRPPGTTAIRN